jgi:epoxyqueuosine reductase
MKRIEITELIKSAAKRLGFSYCGISPAQYLDTEALRLERWLAKNRHGDMHYLADQFELRVDPRRLLPSAKSVISLMINYCPERRQPPGGTFRIAKYAYGKDYHRVIQKKLDRLAHVIEEAVGAAAFRSCVDNAPIMEKAWAQRAGLGWIGKHGVLVRPGAGSMFFLAEIVTDLELDYDQPAPDRCGTCRRCIDACPTGAIVEPHVIDAGRCISYLTIELRESFPEEMAGEYCDWIYGCDACQDACPFNRFAVPHREPEFEPHPGLFDMTLDEWRKLSPRQFAELFQGSAVGRIKYGGLMRNIRFLCRQLQP